MAKPAHRIAESCVARRRASGVIKTSADSTGVPLVSLSCANMRAVTPRPSSLRTVYWVVVAALLCGTALVYLAHAIGGLFDPFERNYTDGISWAQAAVMFDWRAAYHPLQQYPFLFFPYPPVYFVVLRVVGQCVPDLLIAGRLTSAISICATCLIVGRIVAFGSSRRIPRLTRRWGALLATLLCFQVGRSIDSVWYPHPDSLGMLLTFAGVWLYAAGIRRRALRLSAFVVLLVALFTKQVFVAAPLACLAVSFLVDPREALADLAIMLGMGFTGLAVLARVTNGEFLRHAFVYNVAQPFSPDDMVREMAINVREALPIVVLAGLAQRPLLARCRRSLASTVTRLRAAARTSPYHRVVMLLSIQMALAFLRGASVGKPGTDETCFLEWNLAAVALAGLLLVRVLDRWHAGAPPRWARVPLLLLAVVVVSNIPRVGIRANDTWRITTSRQRYEEQRRANSLAVLQLIKNTPGPVLSDDAVMLMRAGKALAIEPAGLAFLSETGTWDPSPFLAMISARGFSLIVVRDLSGEIWPRAMAPIVEQSYELTNEFGRYRVYRPRS